jgi:hypothetical protein
MTLIEFKRLIDRAVAFLTYRDVRESGLGGDVYRPVAEDRRSSR